MARPLLRAHLLEALGGAETAVSGPGLEQALRRRRVDLFAF